jgi:hypothetical protein
MEPAPKSVVDGIVAASPGQAMYGTAVDRESAAELLRARAEREAAARAAAERDALAADERRRAEADAARAERARPRATSTSSRSRSTRDPLQAILTTAGTTLAREITRSIFGTRRRR